MLESILIALIIAIDQAVKFWSEATLMPLGTSLPVIPGVFQLTSAHNTGAAWGMLPGKKWLFLPLTILVFGFLLWILLRNRKRLTVLSRVTLSLLFAGAVGNAIDRAALSYVRDMFDFYLINFPIFNVADSSLSIGCCLLIGDILFLKERSLFDVCFPSPKQKAVETAAPSTLAAEADDQPSVPDADAGLTQRPDPDTYQQPAKNE